MEHRFQTERGGNGALFSSRRMTVSGIRTEHCFEFVPFNTIAEGMVTATLSSFDASVQTATTTLFFILGAFCPQKPHGFSGTGEEWNWE